MNTSPSFATTIYEDGTYLQKNPTWHEEDSAWKAGQILTMLNQHQMQPRTLCEVGCGAGGILTALLDNLPTTTAVGYEVSPQAFARCRAKANDRLEFRLEDILSTDDMYDLVMAIDVFEHIEDYIGFLRKLKGHGRFQIFHIPLDISVQTVLRGSPLRLLRDDVGHLHHFTKETALGTLAAAGYKVLDWFYTPGMIDGPGGNRYLSKLAYWPRKFSLRLNRDLAVRVLGGCSLLALCE
jgi:hypothetical protein